MRLCIVGQGPTAEGHGEEIDAYDKVVRIKNYWETGALDAGTRVDVVAHYGDGWASPPEAAARAEQWFTQTPRQLQLKGKVGEQRLRNLVENAKLGLLRWVTEALWCRVCGYLWGHHPSTGMIAVAMGLEFFPDCELVLYGFDGTLPDLPNYWDARMLTEQKAPHDLLAEKRAIAEIYDGTWLGFPTKATLTWPQMPDLGAAQRHLEMGASDGGGGPY